MTQKLDFQRISRKELRAYILSHRADEEALRTYMERLRHEPGVIRHLGGTKQDDWKQLEILLEKKIQGR